MSILDRFRLEGDTVVITGGKSRYGRQMVTDVANAGAKVLTSSRDPTAAAEIAAIEQEKGHDVEGLELDLCDLDSVSTFCTEVVEQYGPVTGLVNNAVARPMAELDGELEDWQRSMKCNATGVFELTRRIGEHIANHGGGSIVNIGSIQGIVGFDETLYEGTEMYSSGEKSPPPDYFFHKGGLVNLTRYLASVYGSDDVRVNCLSPGGISSSEQDPTFVEQYERRTALGRLATDEDVSGAVVFLLSDAAAYITGTNIPIDGGYTAK